MTRLRAKPRWTMGSSRRAAGSGAVLLAALLAASPGHADVRPGDPEDCGICHGDVEFLRQQSGSLERARALHAAPSGGAATAHGELGCAACHTGFERYPHRRRETGTTTCRDCHEEEGETWSRGAHAGAGDGGGADCSTCHGVHSVEGVELLTSEAFVDELSARCVACHAEAALPESDPHRARIACTGCHASHATRSPGDRLSSVFPANQPRTCGACHDTVASSAAEDVHGTTVARWAAGSMGEVRPEERTPPSCSTCHGAHGMLVPGRLDFAEGIVERCGGCHSDALDTYRGTYHGKATALGSEVVAGCHDCHTAHAVLPAEDPGSSISGGRLVETCGACHEHARPAFVEYESHPDPTSRGKNPAIFYSFWFMNGLLVAVLGVFGLHTLLWWVRLAIDRRRGIEHGIGERHD